MTKRNKKRPLQPDSIKKKRKYPCKQGWISSIILGCIYLLKREKRECITMSKRLLLVDDAPLIIKGLRFSLEQDGYECDSAVDGEEAIAKFEQGRYDLILLDVMLPKLSGTEVCQRIREHSNVPIIMLTAKGEDMAKILGLEDGADDYLTKPFNIL